jgi:hypothetical protein
VRNIHAYYFNVEYVKVKNNIVVDALSRIPTSFSMTDISTN